MAQAPHSIPYEKSASAATPVLATAAAAELDEDKSDEVSSLMRFLATNPEPGPGITEPVIFYTAGRKSELARSVYYYHPMAGDNSRVAVRVRSDKNRENKAEPKEQPHTYLRKYPTTIYAKNIRGEITGPAEFSWSPKKGMVPYEFHDSLEEVKEKIKSITLEQKKGAHKWLREAQNGSHYGHKITEDVKPCKDGLQEPTTWDGEESTCEPWTDVKGKAQNVIELVQSDPAAVLRVIEDKSGIDLSHANFVTDFDSLNKLKDAAKKPAVESAAAEELNVVKPAVVESAAEAPLAAAKPDAVLAAAEELNVVKPAVVESAAEAPLAAAKPDAVLAAAEELNVVKPAVVESAAAEELNVVKPAVVESAAAEELNVVKPAVVESAAAEELNVVKPAVVESAAEAPPAVQNQHEKKKRRCLPDCCSIT